MRACELAGFTSVIEQLPQGFDTVISERGLNLSGGQKQRLALALSWYQVLGPGANGPTARTRRPRNPVGLRTEMLVGLAEIVPAHAEIQGEL